MIDFHTKNETSKHKSNDIGENYKIESINSIVSDHSVHQYPKLLLNDHQYYTDARITS